MTGSIDRKPCSTSCAYLDYAATAPLCEEAAAAMAPFFAAGSAAAAASANANSLHSPGRAAFYALEDARRQLADVLRAKPAELLFTSGATEADNAALFGMAHAELSRRKQRGMRIDSPRIVTTAIEHHAVLEPAKRLRREGFDVVQVRPNRAGFIEPAALAAALSPQTVLVSVQMANSEIGAVQPIAQLAQLAHTCGALFHTDATQALGKIPVDMASLDVDAASFSAHKIGGPKGVGLLYVKLRTPFEPYLLGGGQESQRRSGTQNVPGAVGFAAAAQAARRLREQEAQRLCELRDWLYGQLAQLPQVVPTVEVPPASCGYLPSIVHCMVRGMESETIILRLDDAGVCISGGSACSSQSLDPSHVLTALGIPSDLALGAVRVSMGRYTEQADVVRFLQTLASIVGQPARI